jgi:hypothetical protein
LDGGTRRVTLVKNPVTVIYFKQKGQMTQILNYTYYICFLKVVYVVSPVCCWNDELKSKHINHLHNHDI